MFATDRDLLILEPNLFRDCAFAGQRLLAATGTITGSTLAISAPDVTLAEAGITAGHIALVDGTPYEVIERASATELTISRPRPGSAGPIQPPTPVAAKPVTIHTFAPQIALVHAQLLRMLDLQPSGSDGLTEDAIRNAPDLALLESLGALHLVFALSAAPLVSGQGSGAQHAKAAAYQQRFAAERARAGAAIDTDGDGIPNAIRRFTPTHPHRS